MTGHAKMQTADCADRADQGPVVQTMDSAIRRINHYPVDKS